MPVPALWASGTNYVVGDTVTHEGVQYSCLVDHTADATTEPDVGADADWQAKWSAISPTWGDWLYFRMPAWVRALDAQNGNPMYRFFRIFGRAMNQSQQDANVFPLLKDPDNCPTAYLDDFAALLGILLPHAVDDAAQRRFLSAIVSFYKRKGCRPSIEFIASRYLGLNTLQITLESVPGRFYKVVYDVNEIVAVPPNTLDEQKQLVKQELLAILKLYQPAGLISVMVPSDETSPVGDLGGGANGYTGVGSLGGNSVADLSDTVNLPFQLNVLITETSNG